MKIAEIEKCIEDFAPLAWQEDYDNSGLQVGNRQNDVNGILATVDINIQVVEEAWRKGCNVIIAHHPVIFHGLKKFTQGSEIEKIIEKAIRYGIAIYIAHTNLDSAKGGISWKVAEKLGLKEVSFLDCQNPDFGIGVVGILDGDGIEITEWMSIVKQTINQNVIRHSAWHDKMKVKKVGIVGGSGGSYIEKAIERDVDVFLTSDVKYHDFGRAEGRMVIADIGHYESEQWATEIFCEIIQKKFPTFAVQQSEVKSNLINYF